MKKRKKSNGIRQTLKGVLAIMIGITLCTTTTVLGIDVMCQRDIDKWMPIYPNAELEVMQQRGMVRPRATGTTVALYYTEDDAATVRRWYRDYRRELTTGEINGGNPDSAARGIASTSNYVYEADDRTGTYIRQTSECAND